MQSSSERFMALPQAVVRACKKRKFRSKVADSTGADLTGGQLLMRALILRRVLLRQVLSSDEQYVGVLLPPSTAGVLANAALTLDQRIAVNLNYTMTADVVNECIAQAGIRRVLTSRAFIDKLRKVKDSEDFSLNAESVYLEDFRNLVTLGDKVACALAAYCIPSWFLNRALRLGQVDGDDVVTIIFTSGSTGVPKGVMLTYANVASNVEAIEQVVHLCPQDVLLGILPFFHSFGYTVTIWTAAALNIKAVYHFNPLEAKQVGKLAQKHGATLLLTTPTFLRSYLRRCTTEQFAALDTVVTGAEKMPRSLADAFEAKFGVRPVEGYGTTELSPLVSVNVPPSRSRGDWQSGRKEGTIGRTVPHVSAKIVDLETGKDLGANQTGMLLVKGPNVMKGYLGQPEKTAQVMRGPWYVTGDVAQIDEEGFIRITGRESRFSKIGGEMVPHIQIEEKLNELLGADEEEGLLAVVTSVPDAKKGERLIVLHTAIDKSPGQLCAGLAEAGMPNLYIPAEDCFCQVDELPVLGTGKLDLRGMKNIAEQRFASGGS